MGEQTGIRAAVLAGCTAATFACTHVSIARLPPDLEDAVLAARAMATWELLREGHLPTECVLVVDYGACCDAADPDVARSWGGLWRQVCDPSNGADRGHAEELSDELHCYLDYLGLAADPGLGPFSARLQRCLDDPDVSDALRRLADLGPDDDRRSNQFGELMAGYMESVYGVGFAPPDRRAPLEIGVRQTEPGLAVNALHAEQRLISRLDWPQERPAHDFDLAGCDAHGMAGAWQQLSRQRRNGSYRGFVWTLLPGSETAVSVGRLLEGHAFPLSVSVRFVGGAAQETASQALGCSELRVRLQADCEGRLLWRARLELEGVVLGELVAGRR